jgi:hypothetical protein
MMCIDSIQVSLPFNIVNLLKLWINIVAHPHTIHHLGMNIYYLKKKRYEYISQIVDINIHKCS